MLPRFVQASETGEKVSAFVDRVKAKLASKKGADDAAETPAADAQDFCGTKAPKSEDTDNV